MPCAALNPTGFSLDNSPQRLSNFVLCLPLHRQSEYGGVVFGGWARMAQTISSFSIVEVAKPNIGESWPARVRADVTVNLNVQDHIKHEWEGNVVCVCLSIIGRSFLASICYVFSSLFIFVSPPFKLLIPI